MSFKLRFILLGGLLCSLLSALDFPSPSELNQSERWKSNASAPMKIEWDATENAVRFSADFKNVRNKWMYPIFQLRENESLKNAQILEFEIKLDTGKASAAHVMLPASPAVKGYYPYQAPPPGKWRKIKLPLSTRLAVDKGAARTLKIGINPQGEQVSLLLRDLRLSGKPAAAAKSAIRATAPGTVFTEKESPKFEIAALPANLRYHLTDWRGTLRQEGQWNEKLLTLPPLAPGFYTLAAVLADGTQITSPRSFAVVTDPAKRVAASQSFFGVDTAQSWLAVPGKTSIDSPNPAKLISELVQLAGITQVRDRLSWNEVNTAPKHYQWGRFMENAEQLAAHGIRISNVYARCPAFIQKRSPRLPDNLLATWQFARDAATAFRGKVSSWEVWNEPDIHYAPEPVWEFAATLKAAYLGHKAGAPEIPVLPGAVCSMVRNAYDYGLYANDVARYANAVNFHTYAALVRYPRIFAEFRAFMKKCGLENRALWITENGTNLEGTVQHAAHSPEQELLVAEFLPKSQILLMMEGVSKSYFFVFPPYLERGGKKDWGILRRDGTVKPAYTAFSTLTAQLATAKLLGEIKTQQDLRIFLFAQPDKTRTIVFWSRSDIDTATEAIRWNGNLYNRSFTLPAANGNYVQTDMMGGRTEVSAVNGVLKLNATRFPTYISGLSGVPAANIAPFPRGDLQSPVFSSNEDPDIVIKPYLNQKDFRVTNLKSLANLEQEEGRIHLDIWNFSPMRKSGSLQITGASAALPANITLPPFGKMELDLMLKPFVPQSGAIQEIIIGGQFNDKRISPANIPIHLNRVALRNLRAIPLEAEKPERWRRNDSALRSSISYDTKEKALRVDAEWDGKYAWIYPEYVLNLPQESFRNGAMLSFEIKSVQDKVENDFNYTYVMLVNKNAREHGKAEYLDYSHPLTGWETRLVPFHAVKMPLDTVKMLRIGMNPKGKKLTFWIRNLRLYVKKDF